MKSTHDEILKAFAKDLSLFLISLAPGGEVIAKAFSRTTATGFDLLFSKSAPQSISESMLAVSTRVTEEIMESVAAAIGTHEFGAHLGGLQDVQLTLASSSLTLDKLFELGLDPRNLERYLRGFCPAEHQKWASHLRREVYGRALSLSCDYIVVAASSLPGFQVALARALLARMDSMTALLREAGLDFEKNRSATQMAT